MWGNEAEVDTFEEREPVRCCVCGGQTVGEQCEQCGNDMCAGCHEGNLGVCPRCNGEAKRLTQAIAPNAKRCAGCGRILTRLPSNAVCLNESCELAGRLIPYLTNMKAEAYR